MPRSMSGRLIATVTSEPQEARKIAAWPAAFPPPTTVTGPFAQDRISSSVAA